MTPRLWNLLKVICITFLVALTYFVFILLFNYYYKQYYTSNYKLSHGEERCVEGGQNSKDGNCKINKFNKLVFDGNVIVKIENNIYPKIGSNIKFLLQSVSEELINKDAENIHKSTSMTSNTYKNKFIYVTIVTTSTKLYLKNWLCSIYGLEKKLTDSTVFGKVLLISLDSDLCQEIIKEYKLLCLYIPAGDKSNSEIKTIDMLRKWNIFVVDLLKEIVDQGINVFYFDTNTIWLKDPLTLINNTTLIDDADIVLPIKEALDQPFRFSPSPILIHSTEASKNFLSKIILHLKSFNKDDLQSNVINEVINELCQEMYYGIVCREFSREDVCDMRHCSDSRLPSGKMNQTIIFNDFDVSINNSQRYNFIRRRRMWFLNSYHNGSNKCLISRIKEVSG
uniref:Nucleotid_trans domain-containing protein n=1 Tax=Strongyloides papillosus TaxID=174720 RepID=A0A0N5C0Z6_STREA